MDKETAERLARKFLSEQIEMKVYSEMPPDIGIYGFDKESEILIGFSLYKKPQLGQSKYLAVSKSDGTVRYLGEHGE